MGFYIQWHVFDYSKLILLGFALFEGNMRIEDWIEIIRENMIYETRVLESKNYDLVHYAKVKELFDGRLSIILYFIELLYASWNFRIL